VLECDFSGSAQELLQILQGIEKKLGRKPKLGQGYESRVIDLDIILFKNQEISSEELTVPHPFFAERKFVLLPLVELIENGLFHGVQNTLAECFFALDDKSKILVVDKIQLIC
jgi:7,8-dihydro-6-hydroxymethylpterin-pyrophosphokinase